MAGWAVCLTGKGRDAQTNTAGKEAAKQTCALHAARNFACRFSASSLLHRYRSQLGMESGKTTIDMNWLRAEYRRRFDRPPLMQSGLASTSISHTTKATQAATEHSVRASGLSCW
jgi:hypothetical protein